MVKLCIESPPTFHPARPPYPYSPAPVQLLDWISLAPHVCQISPASRDPSISKAAPAPFMLLQNLPSHV